MTQLELSKKSKVSLLVRRVAKLEGVSISYINKKIAEGRIVIPNNKNHKLKKPCGIGEGLCTKVNVNLGTSTDDSSIKNELKKLEVSVKFAADTVMDLSVGGNLRRIRQRLIKESPIPLGTVPIYEATVRVEEEKQTFLKMNYDDMRDAIIRQAEDGVDFMTIHAGVTRKAVSLLRRKGRILDIVSRGGAILAAWMAHTNRENPFYENFDDVLRIARDFDVTLSLGDGMRPGSIIDATDEPQIEELKTLAQLAERARKNNVQVMIEGPGHVPLDQIKKNIVLQKRLCKGAPFYVLGPLVCDIASGYDHISSAIGASLAASYGADFLCYVTPAEHLRLPDVDDVKTGLISMRIAAHSADLAKGIKSSWQWDKDMSQARRARDWQKQISLSIDPENAKRLRDSSKPNTLDVCTMCGKYCSIKLLEKAKVKTRRLIH